MTTTPEAVLVAPPAPPPPAAPAPAAAPPAPPPVVAAPADADPGDGSLPKWVAARLEQAKRVAATEVLRSIGAETPEQAKAAVERAKAAADAEKSAADKAAEATARAALLQKERDDLHSTVGVYAAAQLSALTAEQRAAVVALAGDSPAAQLRTLDALRPTWTAAPPAGNAPPVATSPPVAPPAPAPLAAPANTAPPQGAPPAGAPPAQVDHLAVLKTLETTNPIRAARYRTTYASEIEAASKARGSK